MQELFLSEQELQRRDELKQLLALGIDPYPAASFDISDYSQDLIDNYEEGKVVSIAGRITQKRIMGKASFAEIQDDKGKIQTYINRDQICEGEDKTYYNEVFKKLLSPGDIVGIKGYMFMTQTGEVSIHVSELTLLCKILRPISFAKESEEKQYLDVLTDTESRYRMRYLDLIVHPEVKDTFRKRAKIISTMRRMFDERDWLEVETPILQPIHGGASARPFKTHHNTLDMPLYMRIANELYLKRLIVGGFEGVYEFGKMFRNEGMDRTHNPEFTSLEFYVAYKDYEWMMQVTEEIFEKVALALHGKTLLTVSGKEIEFKGPYQRLSITEAITQYTGVEVETASEEELRAQCKVWGMEVDESMGKAKLIDEIFGEKVEASLIQPTFIMDHPVEMSPLTKKHRSKPGMVERFELYVNGKEIANAYSELNDPLEQRARFEEQLKLAERGDEEAMALDEDFLRALEFGMPPTAGIGIGIDRMTMLMTDNHSIQDVLFFPAMRPEKMAEISSPAEFEAVGVPSTWVPLVIKSGVATVKALKEANPNKLFQDICGLNKKFKLGLDNPSKELVESWCNG